MISEEVKEMLMLELDAIEDHAILHDQSANYVIEAIRDLIDRHS